MTFGEQIRMISGAATNGDTSTGWLAGRRHQRLWARSSHGRRSIMKAATGLPSACSCPQLHSWCTSWPAWQRPVSSRAWLPGTGNARLVFLHRQGAQGCPGRPERRAVIAAGPICRYRAHGITFESCSSGKLSCRQYTSTQRTNGAPSRRGTQTSLSGSVAPGTSTAVCPSRPGYHTPGTSSPSRFDSADGRSGPGSPTTRNATSWTTALRLTCSSGGAPPAQPRDRGRDQAPATMTGTLRAIIGLQRPCSSSAQARASRQKSLVVSASERPVA